MDLSSLDTMLRSMSDTSAAAHLLSASSAESLDSLMASLPPDQQKYFLDDDIFTPLISPAMTPSMGYHPHHQRIPAHQHHHHHHHDVDFSPLTSPAIMPQPSGDMTPGQIYEQYEQLERAKQMITRRLSELQRKRPRDDPAPPPPHPLHHHHALSARQPAPLAPPPPPPPAKVPLSPAGSPCIEPVTPSSLMNLKSQQAPPLMPVAPPPPPPPPAASSSSSSAKSSPTSGNSSKRSRRIAPAHYQQEHASPRALKPLLISPTLRPGPTVPVDAERMLATRSNYQNLMEGKAAALGIAFSSTIKSGLEVRRTAHKAAEQKRRDSLKEWFDRLRREVDEGYVKKNIAPPPPPQSPASAENGDGDDGKPLSKVLLLKYAYEYIATLKSTIDQRDERIHELEQQLNSVSEPTTAAAPK